MDLKEGVTVSTHEKTDGVNQALFFDNERFLVGGVMGLMGIELQIRHVSAPEAVAASWTLDGRRCGSAATLHDILLDSAGELLLVSGEINRDRFIAVLDADTLAEQAVVFDVSWEVSLPTVVDAELVVTAGDAIRFWDTDGLNVVFEHPLDQPAHQVLAWDETLLTVDVQGEMRQYECRGGGPLR
jgi:hypothetical protein